MDSRRFRQRFVFWLNTVKDDEFALAEEIDRLKAERSFARTVRDGIRLIVDLRAGQTNVLFELFPDLKVTLQARPPAPDNDELRKRLDMLEQFILMRGDGDKGMVASGVGVRTPRPTIHAKLPPAPPPVVEVDTSETFLNAF